MKIQYVSNLEEGGMGFFFEPALGAIHYRAKAGFVGGRFSRTHVFGHVWVG